MQVRLATRADAPHIARMSRDYIETGLGWSWDAARVFHSISDPETVVAVAQQESVAVGFSIMRFKESSAHLDLLAVEPEYRRKGIGRALVQWLEASAKTAGTFQLSLEVRKNNAIALGFYSSLGYESNKVLRGYYGGVESAIRMVKDLSVQ